MASQAGPVPSPQAILRLYSTTLRTARAFSSYNFREYFLRRTKSAFRELQTESDPQRRSSKYAALVRENAVMRRASLVNQMYGGWRLVVEKQKPTHDRGDT